MEILFMLLLFGLLGKGTTNAMRGDKKWKPRTNWDRLSYEQKAWLHDHSK